MSRMKLGILISGRGSNMTALIDACKQESYPAEVTVVISNRPKAKGLKTAESHDIPTAVVDHKDYEDRGAFEAALEEVLQDHGVDLICLAGFMRLLGNDFVNNRRDRMINIHPSLLPAYRGLHTHQRVIEAGVKFTGCTVHYVRPEMDDGPVIIQAAVPVLPDDTEKTLAARVLKYEHIIYPEAVRLIAGGKARVSGHRVYVPGPAPAEDGLINPPVRGDASKK